MGEMHVDRHRLGGPVDFDARVQSHYGLEFSARRMKATPNCHRVFVLLSKSLR